MAEIMKMDAHTWRLEDGFVRFFLLEGEEKAMLIDSGVACLNAKELAETLTDKPILLLNTHGDRDHTSGTGSFSEIHMHIADYQQSGISSAYPNTALAEIQDGDVIDLGNRPLKMVHIPGHTGGSIAILDVNNRALYAGDSVQKGHIYMFGRNRVPESYESSLDKLISLQEEYDRIYASHDEFEVPGDYAKKVKAAWIQVQAGEVEYEMIDLFGNPVKSYTTKVCGFYLQ